MLRPFTMSRRQMLAAAIAMPVAQACAGPRTMAQNAPQRTVFGINFYSLFLRALYPRGTAATAELAELGNAGIPFVRFPASGQQAGEWSILDNDPARYWGAMDAVFAAAEKNRIKLVPSLFWNPPTLPFHMGETVQAWADPQSKTSRFAHTYIETFAKRYDGSSAMFMYEFSNELNIWADLPNVAQFWPKTDPSMPDRKPLPGDALSSRLFRQIADSFADQVRAVSSRGIEIGSDNPRGNAWHLARRSWTVDNRDQYIDNLRAITPAAASAISIHLYPSGLGTKTAAFATAADCLSAMVEAARLDNKLTFLGEFGVPRNADAAEERRQFAAMIDAIRSSGVNYAALWNYAPFAMQPEWDVTRSNDRAYQFEALVAANKG